MAGASPLYAINLIEELFIKKFELRRGREGEQKGNKWNTGVKDRGYDETVYKKENIKHNRVSFQIPGRLNLAASRFPFQK
jgi:hypothetical protein